MSGATAKAFNVSILFRADVKAAKAGVADLKRELGSLGGAAGQAAAGTTTASTAIDQQGAAAKSTASAVATARQAVSGLAAANSTAMPTVNTMTAAMAAQETAMQKAVSAFAGLRSVTEAGTASGLRHGMMLDEIRARYNPLFAASRQYEMVLRDVAEAERLGAISATEAAAARQRAAQAMLAPVSNSPAGMRGAGATSSYAANLSFQMNDVMMMTAMGQDPFMLMIQQGPQVAQIFGQMKASGVSMGAALAGAFRMMMTPWGLAAMAVIGGGAALVQWMMSGTEKAKTLDEAMGDLSARMSDYLQAVRDAGMETSALHVRFGDATTEARKLLRELQAIEKSRALTASVDAFNAATGDMGLKLGGAASGFGADLKVLAKTFGLDVKDGLQRNAASAVRDAMSDMRSAIFVADPAERLSRMNAAMTVVVEQTRIAVDLDGKRTKEEEDLLAVLVEQKLKLDELSAAEQAIIEARRQAVTASLNDIEAIRRQIGLIGASNAERARANALAEAEVEIQKRKLGWLEAILLRQRAITKAQEQARLDREQALSDIRNAALTDTFDNAIAGTRDPYARARLESEREYARQIAEGADAQVAAAEAARVHAKALSELARAQQDYLFEQEDALRLQRIELQLAGRSEAVRARVLAMARAEQDIRRLGLQGEEAEAARRNALAQADLAQVLERQEGAWGKVQSSAESAIDGITEALMGGDIEGALEALAGDVGAMFTELAITNPLKNAILGTDYGTLADVGGLQGIWRRLSGQDPVDEAGLASSALAPASMQVTTPMVQISTSGIVGLGGIGPAANSPLGPRGTLSGSGDVQSQVWNFFRGKGLQPHQVAAIMGNVQAESSFNPFAVGDGGTSFGLFQHHAARGRGLLGAVGGKAGLGDIGAQLEYVWQELLTSENGVLKRLMAAANVKDATGAFVGFERPQGWSAADPTGAHNWAGRLGAAEAALAKFGTATTDATSNLGTLGNGFGIFGNALAQGLQGLATGGARGGLGGFLGTLATGIASALKIPGFDKGGWTGPGAAHDVAGLVHAGEFVFDAAATRRLGVGNLEAIRKGAMRGYQSGGYVTGGRAVPPAAVAPSGGFQLTQVFEDRSSRGVRVETEETTDAAGQRQQRLVLSDAVADGLGAPGGRAGRVLNQVYGMRRAGVKRQ